MPRKKLDFYGFILIKPTKSLTYQKALDLEVFLNHEIATQVYKKFKVAIRVHMVAED
jgi:hypothetical protein